MRSPPDRADQHLVGVAVGEKQRPAQMVSPYSAWDLLGASTQPVTLAPEATAELRYPVTVPATARPGSSWWALVKQGKIASATARAAQTPLSPLENSPATLGVVARVIGG